MQDNKETGYLKEQLEQAEEEVTSLKDSLKSYQTMEDELKEAKQQIHEFVMGQKDDELQHQESLQQYERQTDSLVNELHEKEELVAQLDQLIADKDQAILEKEELVQQLIEDQRLSLIHI